MFLLENFSLISKTVGFLRVRATFSLYFPGLAGNRHVINVDCSEVRMGMKKVYEDKPLN